MKKEKKKKNPEIKKDSLSKEKKKTLINILVFIGIFIAIFLFVFFVTKTDKSINYKGIEFNTLEKAGITFYYTYFNVTYQKKPAQYYIYLRNNPKKLDKQIPFEGELSPRNFLVMNISSENLSCDGDGVIAIANCQDISIFDIEIMRDENASCDEEGRYTFIQIEEGTTTKIEQYGPSCYRLTVNNCEILPVTERLMIEYFVKVYEKLGK